MDGYTASNSNYYFVCNAQKQQNLELIQKTTNQKVPLFFDLTVNLLIFWQLGFRFCQ